MESDRVVELLKEIRDAQRRLLESHQQALRNQEEAIRVQRVAVARARRLQGIVAVAIVVVLGMALWLIVYVARRYA